VVDSVGGTFDFAFDPTGRLVISSTQFGTVQYAYDADNRATSRQVTGQAAVQYSYDAVGNLLSAALPQAAVNLSYDARNEMQQIARPNGISSQYSYDQVGRVLSIAHSSAASTLNSLIYAYDSVGNRSSAMTNLGQPLTTPAVTSQFDADNRLTQSTSAAGAATYAYDDNGNLLSKTDATGVTAYTWDSRNRLVSIAGPAGQVTRFTYDFGRNLISQNDSSPILNRTRTFVLDNLTNLAYVSQSNGDNLSVLAGQQIDEHLAVIHAGGQVEYGLTDALNSTTVTVDQTGQVLASLLYEPFGQTSSNGSNYPFQYTGRVAVGENLYNYRERFYDSATGRFVSEDPLGVSGSAGTNGYRYAWDSPVDKADPSGLDPDADWQKIVHYFDDYLTPDDPTQKRIVEVINSIKRALKVVPGNWAKGCEKGLTALARSVQAAAYADTIQFTKFLSTAFNPWSSQGGVGSTQGGIGSQQGGIGSQQGGIGW